MPEVPLAHAHSLVTQGLQNLRDGRLRIRQAGRVIRKEHARDTDASRIPPGKELVQWALPCHSFSLKTKAASISCARAQVWLNISADQACIITNIKLQAGLIWHEFARRCRSSVLSSKCPS